MWYKSLLRDLGCLLGLLTHSQPTISFFFFFFIYILKQLTINLKVALQMTEIWDLWSRNVTPYN